MNASTAEWMGPFRKETLCRLKEWGPFQTDLRLLGKRLLHSRRTRWFSCILFSWSCSGDSCSQIINMKKEASIIKSKHASPLLPSLIEDSYDSSSRNKHSTSIIYDDAFKYQANAIKNYLLFFCHLQIMMCRCFLALDNFLLFRLCCFCVPSFQLWFRVLSSILKRLVARLIIPTIFIMVKLVFSVHFLLLQLHRV